MADDNALWYKDPPKLIAVIVGCTVIATSAGTVIAGLLRHPPNDRIEYVVDVSRAMNGRIGNKAKLPAVAAEIVDRTEAQPDIETAVRFAGGDCNPASRPPDVNFGTHNADAIRTALLDVQPRGKSNFANAVTLAAGDLRANQGLTTILIIVGGRDTCSGPRSEGIIRDALDGLRSKPDVKVAFKFVGVKVPKSVRRELEMAKKQARSLHFLAETDYANRASALPEVLTNPTPTPTPSAGDTAEQTP